MEKTKAEIIAQRNKEHQELISSTDMTEYKEDKYKMLYKSLINDYNECADSLQQMIVLNETLEAEVSQANKISNAIYEVAELHVENLDDLIKNKLGVN